MIVLHIGLRKAGSSTLQRFLAVNAPLLGSAGYHYPRIGFLGRSSHFNLANELRDRPEFKPNRGTMADLQEYWRDQDGGTLIISSEIFEAAQRRMILCLKRQLKEVDRDVKLFVIIRELGALAQSSYTEQVKGARKFIDFDETFSNWIKQKRADFFTLLEGWAEKFSWDNMIVRILDPSLLRNGDLGDDFLQAIGFDAGAETMSRLERPPPANVSPGWRVTEAMRALHGGVHGLPQSHPLGRLPHLDDRSRRRLQAHADAIGKRRGWNADRGHYLTRVQAEECHAIYAESIRKLNERLSTPLPAPVSPGERGFVERDFLPEASRIPSANLSDFYDELGEAFAGTS